MANGELILSAQGLTRTLIIFLFIAICLISHRWLVPRRTPTRL